MFLLCWQVEGDSSTAVESSIPASTPPEPEKKSEGPTAFDELEEHLSELPPIDVSQKGAEFGKVVLVSSVPPLLTVAVSSIGSVEIWLLSILYTCIHWLYFYILQSFFARNFYNFKLFGLALAFAINFILLFYKVSLFLCI